MADELGYSFQPGAQSIGVGGGVARPSGGPQSAVEIKSFTLPNRFVPGQLAPQALLQSPGGGGQLDVDILRRLMQAFAPQGQQPGVPSLGQPNYHTQPVPDPNVSQPHITGGLFGAPYSQSPAQTPQVAPGPPRFVPGDTPEPITPVGPATPPPTSTPVWDRNPDSVVGRKYPGGLFD